MKNIKLLKNKLLVTKRQPETSVGLKYLTTNDDLILMDVIEVGPDVKHVLPNDVIVTPLVPCYKLTLDNMTYSLIDEDCVFGIVEER